MFTQKIGKLNNLADYLNLTCKLENNDKISTKLDHFTYIIMYMT